MKERKHANPRGLPGTWIRTRPGAGAKLSFDEATLMRRLRKKNPTMWTYTALAEEFNVSLMTAYNVIQRRRYAKAA